MPKSLPQETIRERYDNGRVKVERGVAQDDRENYVNHGPWRMWDEDGNLIAEGVYRYGKRDGKWVRWYKTGDVELFSTPPFSLFTGPYRSQATFRDGELNGPWVITDQADVKICEWSFLGGRRHGESVWYYHTGRKMRVINYRAGELHGELLEWDINGNPVTRVQYEDGRRHEKTQQTYPDGQKKVEGMVLQARLMMKEPDDWWEAKMATYVAKGKDEKHGEWTAWYPNGQQRFAGEYQYDKPAGRIYLVALERAKVAAGPLRKRTEAGPVDLVASERTKIHPGSISRRLTLRSLGLVARNGQGRPTRRLLTSRRALPATAAPSESVMLAARPSPDWPWAWTTLASDGTPRAATVRPQKGVFTRLDCRFDCRRHAVRA